MNFINFVQKFKFWIPAVLSQLEMDVTPNQTKRFLSDLTKNSSLKVESPSLTFAPDALPVGLAAADVMTIVSLDGISSRVATLRYSFAWPLTAPEYLFTRHSPEMLVMSLPPFLVAGTLLPSFLVSVVQFSSSRASLTTLRLPDCPFRSMCQFHCCYFRFSSSCGK